MHATDRGTTAIVSSGGSLETWFVMSFGNSIDFSASPKIWFNIIYSNPASLGIFFNFKLLYIAGIWPSNRRMS